LLVCVGLQEHQGAVADLRAFRTDYASGHSIA
jgi:hypothetical protein